jgi:hypothetical protein
MTSIVAKLREAGLFIKARDIVGDRAIVRAQRVAALPFRGNLGIVGRIYWTDKAFEHRYTLYYQQHLRDFRGRPIRLVEIGIGGGDSPTWGGASLRMWRDYFPRGEIHGIDINEKQINEPRISVHCGDQSDQNFMRFVGREHGPFDVIIDDGSHINAHIQASFDALFHDYLLPGGLYVIEDMATAYSPTYGGGPPGTPGTSAELVKSLIDAVNLEPGLVTAVHAYKEIAFIQKSPS